MLIPKVIGYFKMNTIKRINQLCDTPGASVRQHNHYKHAIRNEQSLNEIRQYIIGNPLCWANDKENPVNQGKKTCQ